MLSLAVAGLWIVWYPPAIAIEDESAYLAQARILARGELTGNRPTDMTIGMVQTANGAVAKFPPPASPSCWHRRSWGDSGVPGFWSG